MVLAAAQMRCHCDAYSLCDIVYNNSAVCVPVVHGRQRLVALLTSSIPYLKLDCCVLVEGDGLGKEGSADGRFSVVVELVLAACQTKVCEIASRRLTFTNRSTSEDYVHVSSYRCCLDRTANLSNSRFTCALLVIGIESKVHRYIHTQQYQLELRESGTARTAALLYSLRHTVLKSVGCFQNYSDGDLW